ncbi:MAG: CRISPR-associated protein Csx3 [bacterium]|nr:CRISPR-associated protein Csx3 [bacterium]
MLTLDLRSLLTTDASIPEGKVNFVVEDLPTYINTFLTRITGHSSITLTGPGPAWLYLAVWHAAHGTIPDGGIHYQAPGVDYSPVAVGVASGDGSAIVEGQIVLDITTLVPTPAPGQRINFELGSVVEYQAKALALLPAFRPGCSLPEFEVVLSGPGPIWLYLALAAALHSRGGQVVYSAPNAARVVVIDHK